MGFSLYSMTDNVCATTKPLNATGASRRINIALRAGGVCLTKWEQVQIVLTLPFANPEQSNHQNSQLIEITCQTEKAFMAVELRLWLQVYMWRV